MGHEGIIRVLDCCIDMSANLFTVSSYISATVALPRPSSRFMVIGAANIVESDTKPVELEDDTALDPDLRS